MRKIFGLIFAVAFASAAMTSAPARAGGNDAVVLGVIGGIFLGAAIAESRKHHHRRQQPVYGAPVYGAPVYRAPVYAYGNAVYKRRMSCGEPHAAYGHSGHYGAVRKVGWHDGAYYPASPLQPLSNGDYIVDGMHFSRTCTLGLQVVAGIGTGCFR